MANRKSNGTVVNLYYSQVNGYEARSNVVVRWISDNSFALAENITVPPRVHLEQGDEVSLLRFESSSFETAVVMGSGVTTSEAIDVAEHHLGKLAREGNSSSVMLYKQNVDELDEVVVNALEKEKAKHKDSLTVGASKRQLFLEESDEDFEISVDSEAAFVEWIKCISKSINTGNK